MQHIKVDVNGKNIYLPPFTRFNRIARVVYKLMVASMAALALVTVVQTVNPLAWYGSALLLMPLPAYSFIERIIKRTQWSESEAFRGLLLGAEMIVPLFVLLALPAAPAILHVLGINPTTNGLALIIAAFMMTIVFSSIPANYTWVRHQLGLER